MNLDEEEQESGVTLSQAERRVIRAKRAQAKAACTRARTYLDGVDPAQVSVIELRQRLLKFRECWQAFEDTQSALESDETSSQNSVAHEAERVSFEEKYFAVETKFEQLIVAHAAPIAQAAGPRVEDAVVHNIARPNVNIRLPRIELPSFSGSYEEWRSFHDIFNTMIHVNADVPVTQKFQYLKASLKGEASDLIASFEISADNYGEAWAMLIERYDNQRVIVQKHIKAIYDQAFLNKENHVDLRQLLDCVLKHLRALRVLGRPTEHWDDLIIHIITTRLPSITNKEWETSLKDANIPTLKQLTDFLAHRCRALEAIHRNPLSSGHQDKSERSALRKATIASVTTVSQACPCCKGDHPLFRCSSFLEFSAERRLQEVRNFKLCANCLKSTAHRAKDCHAGACKKCGKRHNTLLHFDTNKASDSSSCKPVSDNSDTPSVSSLAGAGHSFAVQTQHSLLSTAIINVADAKGGIHACRALLDSGSQSNFITVEMARQLGLKHRPTRIPICGVGESSTETHSSVNLTIRSRVNAYQLQLECLVLKSITAQIPIVSLDNSEVRIPRGITLADPDFLKSAKIDILLGVNAFWSIICVGQIKSTENQPYWQKTQLGWIAAGGFTASVSPPPPTVCNLVTVDDLNATLKRFWDIEHGAQKNERSPEERQCERHFESTFRRNSEGRFVVNLPVKAEIIAKLGESKQTATRRFKTLERRFAREPSLKREYSKFIHEYESLGHLKRMEARATDKWPHYYLPHHCVFKEGSSTTKLRVVFDASCKSATGVSLNDALMVGPTLQQDLFSIMTRFRTFKYVLVADITKMYRQILVNESQTALQRIIWRDHQHDNLSEYELSTVTYGTGPASFLAIKSLRTLADIEATKFPIGSRIVQRDFYVDDLMTGANSIDEAIVIRNETIMLLAKGGFELRQWAANESQLLQGIPTVATTNAILSLDKEGSFKTLGVQWKPSSDVFQYKIRADWDQSKPVTKRSILSSISQIFDPLGLLGPVIVTAKIIMQRLWTLNLGWDESLPLELHTKWTIFASELKRLNDLQIPRQAIQANEVVPVELHGFCDASQEAYGACVYGRSADNEGKHFTALLCAKSRVAPLKTISIPRLELCAAQLLAQLVNRIAAIIDMKINSIHYWTDSKIVIDWIQAPSRKFHTFVANRIGEIQELTSIHSWHHVDTKENPADLLSRGTTPEVFMQQQAWWKGPPWLAEDDSTWPRTLERSNDLPELLEQRRIASTAIALEQEWDIFNHFSSYIRLVRAIALSLRFVRNVRAAKLGIPKTFGFVPPSEIEMARRVLIKNIQGSAFPKELRALQKGEGIEKNSRLLALNPFLDDEGLLRVGGRLLNSKIPYDAKHPVVLPGDHQMTALIIRYEHEKSLHQGSLGTLAAIRVKYWPIGARNIIRKLISKCLTCFKARPRASQQIMGNLPSPRVRPSRPFSHVGVDYCGPIFVREGNRRNSKKSKAWISIFVCFATKAVHIELVSDLSAAGFLGALKRFIGRRGKPSDIFSDNGTNFVGANRELKELRDLFNREEVRRQIVNQTSFDNITWHFSPPRAPHHGGLWEAAVRSMKHHFYRVAADVSLTFEEVSTLLIQIEAILNSRPLTPISNDPADQSFLTPGHFLIGDSLIANPEPGLLHLRINRLSRWQRIEQVRQHFWKRWSSEYLHHLQQRTKWKRNEGAPLKVGQMVIIREDNLPPHAWIVGRIIEVHPGLDNVIRAASIKTSKGILKRASTKLCILPLEI